MNSSNLALQSHAPRSRGTKPVTKESLSYLLCTSYYCGSVVAAGPWCDIRCSCGCWCPFRIEAPRMAREGCVFRGRKSRPGNSGKRQVATCRSRVAGKNHRLAEPGRKDGRTPGQFEDPGSFQNATDEADTVVDKAVCGNPSWLEKN